MTNMTEYYLTNFNC